MKLSLIAAIDAQGAIGMAGKLPWHLPADLQYFRAHTLGKPIVMGRKTFESIGKTLPGRRNIVISHQEGLRLPGCEVFSSMGRVLAACAAAEEVMVIGGGTLYAACLSQAQRLYLTFVHTKVPADTYFPAWERYQWAEISRMDYPADAKNIYNYSFVVLDRV